MNEQQQAEMKNTANDKDEFNLTFNDPTEVQNQTARVYGARQGTFIKRAYNVDAARKEIEEL